MEDIKIRNNVSFWHLVAGILFIALGVYMWFNPVETLVALALYIGIIFVVIGVGYFVSSFTFKSGWYLTVGILDILLGVIFVSNLGVTAVSFPIIFAIWSIAVGVVQLVSAYQYRGMGFSSGWMAAVGGLGVFFGFLILAYPIIGAVAITAVMGAYAILYGVIQVAEYYTNKKYI